MEEEEARTWGGWGEENTGMGINGKNFKSPLYGVEYIMKHFPCSESQVLWAVTSWDRELMQCCSHETPSTRKGGYHLILLCLMDKWFCSSIALVSKTFPGVETKRTSPSCWANGRAGFRALSYPAPKPSDSQQYAVTSQIRRQNFPGSDSVINLLVVLRKPLNFSEPLRCPRFLPAWKHCF